MPALQRILYLTNAAGRDATVLFGTIKPPPRTQKGIPGRPTSFRRFLSSTSKTSHGVLAEAHGESYGQALVDGDPELDLELVGREIGDTQRVFLAADGTTLHAPPKTIEILYDPQGEEIERKAPEDRDANVNDEMPVRWTGRRVKAAVAVRRFVFGRTLALTHRDGLTYDYLFAMAKELAEAKELVMMGAGDSGKDPLVLVSNGTPYRAFLEGRVDGERYQLLLHLSNMELKLPEPPKSDEANKPDEAKEEKA